MQGAYQQSQVASYKANPLVTNLTYTTAGDDKVREEHAEWEGVTLPKDDPFWDNHTPPCGFNCRCIIRVSDEDDKPTDSDDSRLSIPPDPGFEGPSGDLLGTAIAAQAMAVPRLSPADSLHVKLAAKDDLFSWLADTVPAGPLPKGSGRSSNPTPGFIELPDGRTAALTKAAIDAAPVDAREWIRAALTGPSEVWAAPYRDPKGKIVLVLNVLLGVEGRTLCVPVVSGVVPASGMPVHFATDPRSVRRGGRIL